jgi:hypothetical protein
VANDVSTTHYTTNTKEKLKYFELHALQATFLHMYRGGWRRMLTLSLFLN